VILEGRRAAVKKPRAKNEGEGVPLQTYRTLQALEMLTEIELKAPMLLRKTLLSTNPIESAFSKVRGITHRIKNWSAGKNKMITRWSAISLLEAEKSFRTIKGFEEIPVFMKALKEYSLPEKRKAA